ncbi:MAG: glycosyltransferase family 4 protein [Pseudomonadota bacterium]
MAPLRVLAIAEAANPDWVSVPLVGWSLAQALKDVGDVHLVTQVRNRSAILGAGFEEGRDFTVIDSEALARPMHRISDALRMGKGKGWTTATAIAALNYPYFEHLVWQKFGASIRAGDWDVVHRITPLTPTTVSPIAARVRQAGVPFVMGPLNGGVPWPPGFEAARRQEREWLSYVRGVYRMLPGRNRMLRASSAILAGSLHTASELPTHVQDRVIYLPENGILPERFPLVASQNADGPLKAVFVGRLVPYKGPDIALAAAAELLRSKRMQFDIVGDGPMMADLQQQAQSTGTQDSVTFHGHVPHSRVSEILADAHLLLFPSIREFGGGVVLEAMATGVVPLVIDYAGPGELVTVETGFKVPVGPRTQIISDLTAKLTALETDRLELPALGQRARQHVFDHFTWAAKACQVKEVWEWVTGSRSDKPVFF